MQIVALVATDVRNLRQLELELLKRFNVFSGENSHSKTKLREAIFVIAAQHSLRTSKLSDDRVRRRARAAQGTECAKTTWSASTRPRSLGAVGEHGQDEVRVSSSPRRPCGSG